MPPLFASVLFAVFATVGGHAAAEVIRCTDTAGKVSYTDGACAAGTRRVGTVDLLEAASPTPQELEERRQAQIDREKRVDQLQREAAQAVSRQPAPAGPVVIDARGEASNQSANPRPAESRWSDRGRDVIDDGDPAYADPYAAGGYRPNRRPRDMRPKIRSCGPTGCTDTQGNTYNRSGQLDRYRALDGKTCSPVGTTTVCR